MALKIVLMSLLAFCAPTSEAQQTPSQENNITLPISYPARETQGSGTTCPSLTTIRRLIPVNDVTTFLSRSSKHGGMTLGTVQDYREIIAHAVQLRLTRSGYP